MTGADADHFLAAVERRMHREIDRVPIAEPARALVNAGGKRLRARLLWWSAQATAPKSAEPDAERLISAATAIEFAHLGSLIHDDIADNSDMRRGVPTLHRRHGIAVAVDVGTALAHLASEIVADLGRPARHAVRRAILATCRGQIRELALPFALVSPRTRLAIMQEKTGAFFELATALGAIISGAETPHGASVRRFARRFGVAFQIADDVFDLAGDPRELGRPNGADLREGVFTLPVLLAASALGRLPDCSGETIAECAEMVERAGGIDAARSIARWWLARSLRALDALPPNVAVITLGNTATASVERGLRRGATCSYGDDPAASRATGMGSSFSRLLGTPFPMPTSLGPPLARLLRWFHPGVECLASVVATALAERSRTSALQFLRRNEAWSAHGLLATEAVALAHTAATSAMTDDPPCTLAIVDALYCASIGEVCETEDHTEQARLARRARDLLAVRHSSHFELDWRSAPASAPHDALSA